MRRRLDGDRDGGTKAQLFAGRIPMVALIQVLAVAEHLSFLHAAKALGTSQSSVSARIRAREDELGIVVFDRNTRGIRLTEGGRLSVKQIEHAIGIIDHAVKTAGMQARGEQGESGLAFIHS